MAWIGGAGAGLMARAEQLDAEEAVWWALVMASAALPVAVGAVALPVIEGDRRLGWLLRASGCSWPARVAASAVVLVAVGAGLGALAWASGALVAGGSASAAQAAWLVALGGAVGACAVRAGAWAAGVDGGSGRVVVAMAGVGIGAFVALGTFGPVGVAVVAAAGGAGALALAARREAA
ncbi:MAG: hypothetical protein H6709_19860 [Kofleriaceae bacterium]|nr:hypothetical protein [Kofleriaceae bacterium]